MVRDLPLVVLGYTDKIVRCLDLGTQEVSLVYSGVCVPVGPYPDIRLQDNAMWFFLKEGNESILDAVVFGA